MTEVFLWMVFQTSFTTAIEYPNPLADVRLRVTFTAPSGEARSVDAFWDGGGTWRVRFSPDEPGSWRWRTGCSDPTNAGLHDQSGAFQCIPYEGDNPVFRHGSLRVSPDGTHLQHSDATPFFWLADTAWNGVLRATETGWQRYLQTRTRQGFTVIQFVCTHWRGLTKDPAGETACIGADPVSINPGFFHRMDRKVAMINEQGLIAAPVVLWSLGRDDPGQALSESDAELVARYIQARWGAHQVAWLFGGDGKFQDHPSERWMREARAVFTEDRNRLITMHPCGQNWVGEIFRAEPWFDFIGYQSGHGDSGNHLKWLVSGPPATDWPNAPVKPVLNLEPNYEMHPSYHSKSVFGAREVRRAAYWSLLVSPTAGVTYGNNPIWVWNHEPAPAENHAGIGTVQPWESGLEPPGVESMSVMRSLLDRIAWWRLRPSPELLAHQPGDDSPDRFVAVSRTEDGSVGLAYLPQGGAIGLDTSAFAHPSAGQWFDPRTGELSPPFTVEPGPQEFAAPDDQDWVLLLSADR